MAHAIGVPKLSLDELIDVIGALLVVLDAEGRLVSFNAACERVTGYKRAQVLGSGIWDLLIPPEQRTEVKSIFAALLQGQAPNNFTNDWIGKDGERRRIAWSNTVARRADGTVEYVIGAGIDMTDQLAAEAALRNNRSLLQMIINTSPEAIITIDSRGTVESFNVAAEQMFGYAADEVIGRNVSLLMPEPYASKHDGFLDHYLRTHERRIIGIGREVAAKRKDGTVFPIELAVGEMEFDQRTRFTGFIRDITRIKEAELALRESLERERELQTEFHHVSRLSAMGEMAATLAHELNQPLTAVINYVQATRRLLQSGAPAAQAKVPELVGKAVDQAHRAGEIISHLRSFVTRGESTRVSVDVNAIVGEACDLALVGAKAQGIGVTLALADDLPLTSMDRVQIQQVIVNLVRNSIDALQDCEVRRIEVRTSRVDPAHVAIVVADNGPGLDPEIAAKLFQPFNTSKKNGMGIGLSVCRSIVQEHGGTIDAAPNPGGGVVFTVVLPLEA